MSLYRSVARLWCAKPCEMADASNDRLIEGWGLMSTCLIENLDSHISSNPCDVDTTRELSPAHSGRQHR
jgi:hypothetical protein